MITFIYKPFICFPGNMILLASGIAFWTEKRLTGCLNKRAMMALGRSPEYHWNQIISKSVHRLSRRSRLKLFFLFIALAAILFDRAERFEQFL